MAEWTAGSTTSPRAGSATSSKESRAWRSSRSAWSEPRRGRGRSRRRLLMSGDAARLRGGRPGTACAPTTPGGRGRVVVHEYWTLAKRDGGWCLHSIERAREGAHNLTRPARRHARARHPRPRRGGLRARRGGRPSPTTASPTCSRGLRGRRAHAGAGRRARRRALRRDVLETAVRRAVEAWLDAIDGADDALLARPTGGVRR